MNSKRLMIMSIVLAAALAFVSIVGATPIPPSVDMVNAAMAPSAPAEVWEQVSSDGENTANNRTVLAMHTFSAEGGIPYLYAGTFNTTDDATLLLSQVKAFSTPDSDVPVAEVLSSPSPKAPDDPYISVVQPEHRRVSALSAGGPDGFGYTYTDSDEAEGPTFRWIEIERTGTHEGYLSNGDDSGAIVSLGFDFDFYGETFDEIGISTNGYLSFDKHLYRNDSMWTGTIADLTDYGNDPIPFPYEPDALIAPFWDDLMPSSHGDVYYQTLGEEPNRFFVVEWNDVAHYPWSGVSTRNTFQVILFEGSNDILFQYLTQSGVGDVGQAVAQGGSATIGLEDFGPYPDVTDGGLQYSYNTDVVSDSLAILFEYPSETSAGDAQLEDWFEDTYGVSSANADNDGDGLSNLQEQNARTDPTKTDTDDDGADDNAEVTAGTLGYYPDSDNDRLPDGYELDNDGFDPLDPDVDDDGLVDGLEGLYNCDPQNPDTDGDGLPDGWEAQYIVDFTIADSLMFPDSQDGDRDDTLDRREDPDGDGLTNRYEYAMGADPTVADTDGDSLNDLAEYLGVDGRAPTESGDESDQTDPAKADSDGDGIKDAEEIVAGVDGFVTNPTFLDEKTCNGPDDPDGIPDGWDTDCDGMPDGWETRFGLDPTDKTGDNGAAGDWPDGDGMINIDEYENHTFPDSADSDGDGLSDTEETIAGVDGYVTDPTGEDFDNDGIPDGRDTDGDGVNDGDEYDGVDGNSDTTEDQTDPTDPDSDDDGMPDGFEYDYSGAPVNLDPNSDLPGKEVDWDDDPDVDQLNNLEEYRSQTKPDVDDTDGDTRLDGVEIAGTEGEITFASRADSDDDGLDDNEETNPGTDGYVTGAINPDSDGDSLMDGEEYDGADGDPTTAADRTLPLDPDTDGGGALDGWEVNWGYDARDDTDDADDADADGLDNAGESQYPRDLQRYSGAPINGFVTDPTDDDTDGDSVLDGDEADNSPPSDPTLPDTDGGGAWDSDEALIIPPDTTSSSSDATDASDDHLRRARDTMRQYHPEVVVDSQNYAHLIWRERVELPDGYVGYDLYYAMTNQDGTYRIAPTRVTGYLEADIPKAVADSSGIIHIVWEDERWDRFHDELLYMQIDPSQDDQNGDAASPTAIKVLYDTNLTEYDDLVGVTQDLCPDIVMDGAGDIHVAWKQYRDANDDRIMYLRFAPGSPASPDVDAIEVAIADSNPWPNCVSVDIDSNDTPHLVWHNRDTLDPAYDNTQTYELFYAMLDTDGTPLIDKTLITEDDNKVSDTPDVVVDSNDEVNVVWTDAAVAANEIYYMRLDPSLDDQDGDDADENNDGQIKEIEVVAPFRLTDNDSNASQYAACALYESELHVLWADYRNVGTGEAYYGSYDIAASGNPSVINNEIRLEKNTDYHESTKPGIVVDGSKLVHGVWSAYRPDPEPGYAQYNIQHLAHRFIDVPVDHFTFAPIGDQVPGVSFTIVITAENTANNTVAAYSGQANLSINAGGSIVPSTANFVNGVASLNVKITNSATDVRITATDGAVTGQSNAFDVVQNVYLPLVLREEGEQFITEETEPNDSYAQANGPLGSGQPCSGDIGTNDEKDFFFFNVTNPGNIRANLTGYTGDVWVEIIGPSGSLGSPGNGSVERETQTSGKHYVVVKWIGQPNNSSYQLTVTYP